jgi:hypothetical protein
MGGGEKDSDSCDNGSSDIERAISDIEILRSAYPDETTFRQLSDNLDSDDDIDATTITYLMKRTFPLHVTLYLSTSKRQAFIEFEWNHGYPTRTPLQISVYRDDNHHNNKQRIERTVQAVRATALECYEDGMEAGLACCSTALEVWNSFDDDHTAVCDETEPKSEESTTNIPSIPLLTSVPQAATTSMTRTAAQYQWWTSDESKMIHDRKSIFVGHVCTIRFESDVQPALQQLLSNNNKLQRATHHMVCTVAYCTYHAY